jgi:hypothetical protein
MVIPFVLAALVGADPSVGFIWHYPFVDQGTRAVADTGASTMTSRAPWALIEPEPERFSFECLQRQLDVARAGGFRLILILECNPFCAPPWLKAQVAAVHEMVIGPDGRPSGEPSTTSAVYHTARSRFLGKLIEFLKVADPQHTVAAFHPGIEWWFPPEFRYAPADIARFQSWLLLQYGDVATLNVRWRSDFASFETVSPPEVTFPDLFRKGREGLCVPTIAVSGQGDAEAASYDWFWFWAATAAATIDELAAEVKRLDPTRSTISFQTFTWATAGEWDYLGWCAVVPDEVAHTASHLDALGLQLPISWGDPYQVTVGLDVVRKYDKPVHAVDLLDFTQGQAAGFRVMQRGTHAAIARGAIAVDYCSWAGAGDYSFYGSWAPEDLRRLVAEASGALRLCEGMQPDPDMALVLPFTYPGSRNDPASFVGFYRLLESLHHTVDVVTPRELALRTVDMSQYEAVIVPDAPDLPPSAIEALAGARKLMTTSTFPACRLQPAVVQDFGRTLAAPLRRDSTAGDGPPMLDFRRENPRQRADLAEAMNEAMRQAGIATRVSGLPREVSCTFMAAPNGWGVYLINRTDEPLPPLTCHVCDAALGTIRAWADIEPAACDIAVDGDGVQISLPSFATSCIVRVQRNKD